MKYYFFLIGLGILLLFNSCSEKEHCENYSLLISPNDSIPLISLDFELTTDVLEKEIRKLTSAQNPRKPQKFGLLLNGQSYNSSIHAKHANLTACYGMPAMMHRSPQLEVFITGNNSALMEGKDLIPIDSIPGYISWYFPHDKAFGEKIVKLGKSPLASHTSLTTAIENIAKGYLSHYEKLAGYFFQKSLCDLDSVELIKVRKSYPFELRLWMGDPSSYK